MEIIIVTEYICSMGGMNRSPRSGGQFVLGDPTSTFSCGPTEPPSEGQLDRQYMVLLV